MNKQELALQYFPDAVPETAVRHLMRWVTGCSPLAEALAKTGYQSRNRSLTWRQVLLIHSFLGEPAEQEEPSQPLERKQSGNCVLLAIIKSFAAIVFILRFSIISLMLMISLFSMISCISN